MSWKADGAFGGVDGGLEEAGGLPFCWLVSAMRPAQSGATALVPPMTMVLAVDADGVAGGGVGVAGDIGNAAATGWLVGSGTFAFACQVGSGKTLLTPPPVAPSLLAGSFQTTSEVMVVPLPESLVPPQARTCGLEAGKSTLLRRL